MGDQRALFLALARRRFFRRPQAGEDLITSAQRQLQEEFSRYVNADSAARLSIFASLGQTAEIRLGFEADLDWRAIDPSVACLASPAWLHSVYAQLSHLTQHLYPKVWTPWDAWQHYTQHHWTVNRFRHACALELQVSADALSLDQLQAWAESRSLHDPWTVMRQLGLPEGFRPWTLAALERRAAHRPQQQLIKALKSLREVVRQMPRSRTPSVRPYPAVLLLPADDDGCTVEYADEWMQGRLSSHAFECRGDMQGLSDLKRFLRHLRAAQQATEDVLKLFEEEW
ncbi:hypothetical protein [Deinococcus xinjiangensis]|uniref:hypothetical protein n=1 Tax=Deinococcus xinjiangensis TaxID=457454 RepID=UPI00336554D5